MVERLLFPEFRDQQERTKYPFSDAATLTSNDGLQTIEPDTFLDASLYPIGGGVGLYLTIVGVTPREVTIYAGTLLTPRLCSGSFDPLDPPSLIRMVDVLGRPAGVLVSEPVRLSRFAAWPVGEHAFVRTASEFVASCVIPTPEIGVRGVVTAKGEVLTGDVWIVGDNGIVVREEDGHVRIDVVGDPLYVRKLCVPIDLFTPPTFLKTINGCGPDEYGNFNLIIGEHGNTKTVLRLYPTSDGLVIKAVGGPQRGS